MGKQNQKHERTTSNVMRMVVWLLVVGALVLAACSMAGSKGESPMKSAANAQTSTPISQVASVGGIVAAESELSAPLTDASCTYPTGCILREAGSNAQWWADSWDKGTCRDHPAGSQDWIVTYKVNNDQWRNADQSKIRFYAAVWSAAWFWKWADELQVEDNVLSSGGGIKVCLSGVLFPIDVQGTYLWLQP